MTSDYEQRLWKRMDRLCPDASNRLSEIEAFPEEAAEAVLREILETGCLSHNAANIEAARRAVQELPESWLAAHLPKVLPGCLFREREWQEWEFRRAAEMLEGLFPDAYRWLTEWAAGLDNPEVMEALEEIKTVQEKTPCSRRN